MPYRPSMAWFELNAGSALAGVLPASVQAAAVGSAATLAVAYGASLMDGRVLFAEKSFRVAPWLVVVLLVAILITTPVCALTIALVGAPLAFRLGRRLAGPVGLGVAVGVPLAMALAVAGAYGGASVWGKNVWFFPFMVLAYGLPGGLLYRQAVLTSRTLSPWDEHEPGPVA